MDNQQDQVGSPMPGDDVRVQNAGTSTGSTGLGNNATVSGAGARKSGSARGEAQGASETQATDQNNQQGGDQGQGDGQTADKLLNTVIESGRKWIEDSGVLNSVNQLPQNVKDWGNRAVSRVGDLTTTQKIVGGALLAVGIGLLATRKGKAGKAEKSGSRYGRQSGSYGRSGYQSTDALGSRRSSYGSSSDSGSAYGNSGNSSGSSGYGSGSSYRSGSSSGAGAGSSASGTSTSSNTSSGGDFSPRTSESSYR